MCFTKSGIVCRTCCSADQYSGSPQLCGTFSRVLVVRTRKWYWLICPVCKGSIVVPRALTEPCRSSHTEAIESFDRLHDTISVLEVSSYSFWHSSSISWMCGFQSRDDGDDSQSRGGQRVGIGVRKSRQLCPHMLLRFRTNASLLSTTATLFLPSTITMPFFWLLTPLCGIFIKPPNV